MDINGQIHQFCECTDANLGDERFATGPQCQYECEVKPTVVAQTETQAEVEDTTFYTVTHDNNEIVPLALAKLGSDGVYENDGTCGENACSGAGICFQETCYCKRFYSGDDCEIDTAHPGLPAKTTVTFYSVSAGLGFTMGAFLSKIYNQNGRKLLK